MVQRVGADRATIVLETDLPTVATVAWGQAALDHPLPATAAARRHELALTGLPADALVRYQVTVDGETQPASVQVRTVLQHAWAEFEHEIRYKGTIPEQDAPELDRRFTLAAGLLELADREFTEIRDRLRASMADDRTPAATGACRCHWPKRTRSSTLLLKPAEGAMARAS